MARSKKKQQTSPKKSKTKTKQRKKQSWLRTHLAGILLAIALLFMLGISLFAISYVIFLYR